MTTSLSPEAQVRLKAAPTDLGSAKPLPREKQEESFVGWQPPQPIVVKQTKKIYWLIWLVPLVAAIAAVIYWHQFFEQKGPSLTLVFSSAEGIRPGETAVMHKGVPIGRVTHLELTKSMKEVLVKVRLEKNMDAFTKKDAAYWVVRPEISNQGLTGLTTVLTGPYIDSAPGKSEAKSRVFYGLPNAPFNPGEGLKLVVFTPKMPHLQVSSPVYYRGIQIGSVSKIQLSREANQVEVHLVVWRNYRPLVRSHSKFWVASGFDVKGGIFSGLELKLDSIQTAISGGIGLSTPEQDMGTSVKDGEQFTLADEPEKDWLNWAPKIRVNPMGPPGHESIPPEIPQKEMLSGGLGN
jgi:paraquat-inducible protein B